MEKWSGYWISSNCRDRFKELQELARSSLDQDGSSRAVQRIAVIGNAGGGKSTLSRLLGEALELPVYHVDSIQYRPGWARTPSAECNRRLNDLAAMDRWIIDGFGSSEAIQRRVRAADAVVFVDFPLAVHYLRACKRQWQSRRRQRKELPEDCPEFTLGYSWKLARVMWEVHRNYRPWFKKLVSALPDDVAVFHIRSPREWNEFVSRHTGFRTSTANRCHY